MFDSVRYLLAEFFRKSHGDNSEDVINDPFQSVGLDSPRNVLPVRFFRILGEICSSHTREFGDVMQLPLREDGIGDEAHPRFVACLLRLGDLLDIDNNRFSGTLMKMVNEPPMDTILHKDKHQSISHLSINNKYVEIEAVCSSPQVASVIQKWFDWIEEEFKNQTQRWNAIVPDEYPCHLPMVNSLKISIEDYEMIDGSGKLGFNVDIAKALELLQGGNFYENKYNAIREIIQNAVDSTLIRIYLEAKHENKVFKGIDNDFLKDAKKYTIEIVLDKTEEGNYSVCVTDMGIGLKCSQLEYLINTGSSAKNVEKQLIVDEMPEWMRPSGIFGIGFQSVFLLTDMVEIKTKDYFEDEKMWIELHSPTGPLHGDIYLKKVHNNLPVGFSIQFVVEKEDETKNDKYRDPFNELPDADDTLPMIEKKIREYANQSFVPIRIIREQTEPITLYRDDFVFFDEKTNIEINFEPESFKNYHLYNASMSYRNAEIHSGIGQIMFLNPSVNIHAGKAKDLLTLNRDCLKDTRYIVNKSFSLLNTS